MSSAAVVIIYVCMLAFDLAILAGTAYLIGWCDWSAWWMWLAVIVCAGSNPKTLLKIVGAG